MECKTIATFFCFPDGPCVMRESNQSIYVRLLFSFIGIGDNVTFMNTRITYVYRTGIKRIVYCSLLDRSHSHGISCEYGKVSNLLPEPAILARGDINKAPGQDVAVDILTKNRVLMSLFQENIQLRLLYTWMTPQIEWRHVFLLFLLFFLHLSTWPPSASIVLYFYKCLKFLFSVNYPFK